MIPQYFISSPLTNSSKRRFKCGGSGQVSLLTARWQWCDFYLSNPFNPFKKYFGHLEIKWNFRQLEIYHKCYWIFHSGWKIYRRYKLKILFRFEFWESRLVRSRRPKFLTFLASLVVTAISTKANCKYSIPDSLRFRRDNISAFVKIDPVFYLSNLDVFCSKYTGCFL